ncbi:MAG TPA: hypothetical protein VK501_22840 [Baekduia sp.]|nr:hypothetical protein [Baekduia sp.]
MGDHDRVTGIGSTGRLPPVLDQRRTQLVGGRPGDEAPVIAIRLAPCLDLALAQLRESRAIPRLCLAMDLVQLDRSEVSRESAERAPGIDLRKLAVVADQDELGLRVGGVLCEPVDRARADHASLVDDQHRTRSKAIALVDVDEQPGDRRAVDARERFHLDGSSRGQRAPEDAHSVGFPSVSRGGEASRLPGARRRPYDLHAIAGGRQRTRHRGLLVGDIAPGREPIVNPGLIQLGDSRALTASGIGHDSVLNRHHLGRRVPGATELRSAPVLFKLDGVRGRQPAVGQGFEPLDSCTLAVCLGPVTEDVAAVEGRRVLGDPAGRAQVFGNGAKVRLERRAGSPAIEDEIERTTIEAELCRAGAPLLSEPVGRHVVVLGPAGLQRGDLRCASRPSAQLGEAFSDLLAAAGEMLEHVVVDAADLGGAVANRLPFDAKLLGEAPAQRRLVE